MPLPLDSTIKKINRQAEESSARNTANALGLSYAILSNYPFNLNALSLVPVSTVQEKEYAVYLRTNNKIRVAIVHPENEEIINEIKQLAAEHKSEVELTVVSRDSLIYLIQSYLQLLKEKDESDRQHNAELAAAADKDYFSKIKTIEDLKQEINKVSITEIIDVLMAAGYNQNASDIHIEPEENEIVVRFRIDGVLQKVITLPTKYEQQIVSRIKMLAGLHLDDHTTTQDGRFSLDSKGINADIRVSTIPTGYGEGIVMRILRQDMQSLNLNQLGFSAYNQSLIEKAIHRPYGLIAVTGPTGSGKSTTLYALLDVLNSSEKKIITLEDPIEYRIPGLQQSQINEEKGFTFAEGLRGALRQDPDIVMVGEIRDPETATIALNASLTGHLVLTTLHTNNAVTAHTRFLEMGIAPFLLSGSIQIVIAQRLVRKLDQSTDQTNQPQYKGRLVIAEVLAPNQEFEQAVLQKKDQETLEEIAVRGGMIPMLKDGLEKVSAGLTTESEIYRVTVE